MRLSRISISILVASILFSGCSKLGLSGKPAGIRISSNVSATVTMDGKELGKTPFESTNEKAGKSALKITPSDGTGSPYETSLKLYAGYLTQIDWNFGKTVEETFGVTFEYEDARDKSKSEIQLTASPDNVPVVIDGKNLGFTPLLIDTLAEGDHTVLLQAPGYSPLERTVKLVKGVRTIMTGKLAKDAIPIMTQETSATPSATATPSAIKTSPTPKSTAKPTATPVATGSASKATPTPVPTATPGTSTGTNKPSTSTKPYVEILSTTTGWLRVRDTASSTGKELTKLDTGSTVPYANASASGWLKVKYDGTAVGWVSSDYAKLVQ